VIRAVPSEGGVQDWVRGGVAQSTAIVRKLYFDDRSVDTRVVEEMVRVLPSLETLSLCMYDDVSGPFTPPYLDSFSFRHYSKSSTSFTSLKFLTRLHIILLHRQGWVHVGTRDIGTELRKANSFLLQTPLKVIDVLTSLECLGPLHIIRRHFGVWVIHDISAIATKLRKEIQVSRVSRFGKANLVVSLEI
jgi:hypothetical protein